MGQFEHDEPAQDNDDDPQVIARPGIPPTYSMRPTFAGITPLFTDLILPINPDEIFCSIFIPGGDYVRGNVKGARYKYLQKFTVELFGLVISDKPIVEGKVSKLPDPRQYAWHPKYWPTSVTEVLQIWRTRVFWTMPKHFAPSRRTPLTAYRPWFPYLEERWHPRITLPGRSLGGLDSFKVGFSFLKQFHDDAYRIMTRTHTNTGRPRVFENPEQFNRVVKAAYLAIWHERKHVPLQKEVAERLACNPFTFKEYWGTDGILPWRELFDLWIDKVLESTDMDHRLI